MTVPSQAGQALSVVLAELNQLHALIGRIAYQVSASNISSDGAVAEIRRLLNVTPPTDEQIPTATQEPAGGVS